MSLDVSPALLERAQHDQVDDDAFVDCIRTSLPYAWRTISGLAGQLHRDTNDPAGPAGPAREVYFVDNQVPPPDEAARGELLRVLASDAMRGALERHLGVRLAFQNCHRVAAFPAGAESSPAYRDFVSPRGQLLNQSPQLRNC